MKFESYAFKISTRFFETLPIGFKMTGTGVPVIKKVPGNLVKFDHEKDGFVDLTKLSRTELLDMKQREENLLKNR